MSGGATRRVVKGGGGGERKPLQNLIQNSNQNDVTVDETPLMRRRRMRRERRGMDPTQPIPTPTPVGSGILKSCKGERKVRFEGEGRFTPEKEIDNQPLQAPKPTSNPPRERNNATKKLLAMKKLSDTLRKGVTKAEEQKRSISTLLSLLKKNESNGTIPTTNHLNPSITTPINNNVNDEAMKIMEEEKLELVRSLEESEGKREELVQDIKIAKRELKKAKLKEEEGKNTSESFWQKSVAATRALSRLEDEVGRAKERREELEQELGLWKEKEEGWMKEREELEEKISQLEQQVERGEGLDQKLIEADIRIEVLNRERMALEGGLDGLRREAENSRREGEVRMNEEKGRYKQEIISLRQEFEDRFEQEKKKWTETQLLCSDENASGESCEGERKEESLSSHGLWDNRDERISELEEKVREGERQRRKMHNLIQELRGNVRVLVRCRPFLPSDGVEQEKEHYEGGEEETKRREMGVRCGNDGSSVNIGSTNRFLFDQVLGPTTSQEDVFSAVEGFVQSAMDGYSICLFSYGQTGSGYFIVSSLHITYIHVYHDSL